MKNTIMGMLGIAVMAVVLMATAAKPGVHLTAGAQSVGNPMLLSALR